MELKQVYILRHKNKVVAMFVLILTVAILTTSCTTKPVDAKNPNTLYNSEENQSTEKLVDTMIGNQSDVQNSFNGYADLKEISKHESTYFSGNTQISDIVDLLPPITDEKDGQFRQNFHSTQSYNAPYRITLYYEPVQKSDNSIDTHYSLSAAENNAAILMAFIDDLDEVIIKFRENPSYDTFGKEDSYQDLYKVCVTFKRSDLSLNIFDGNDFENLSTDLKKFNELLIGNAKQAKIANVEFIPTLESYFIPAYEVRIVLPPIWMENTQIVDALQWMEVNSVNDSDQWRDDFESMGVASDDEAGFKVYGLIYKPRHLLMEHGYNFIGVIYAIPNSIWDEKNYDDSDLEVIGSTDGYTFAFSHHKDTELSSENSALDSEVILYNKMVNEISQSNFQEKFKVVFDPIFWP